MNSKRTSAVFRAVRSRIHGISERISNRSVSEFYLRGDGKAESMTSLEEYLERRTKHDDNVESGPLFPLSEYGRTCFLRGCEEMHVECADKTDYIVEHCDCDPKHPDDAFHRHVYEYEDLLDPPPVEALGDFDPTQARPRPPVLDAVALHNLLMERMSGARQMEFEMQYSPASSYEVTISRPSYSPTETEASGKEEVDDPAARMRQDIIKLLQRRPPWESKSDSNMTSTGY